MIKRAVLIAAIWLGISLPAISAAQNYQFYGQARLASWYLDGRNWGLFRPQDYDQRQHDHPDKLGRPDQTVVWDLMTTARLGATVSHGKHLTGMVEYGAGGSTGVNLRHLVGTWRTGGFEVLVGQTWTPTTLFYSDQAFGNDDILFSNGVAFAGRRPQLRLSYKGFKLALINVHNASSFDLGYITGPPDPDTGKVPEAEPDVDVFFPKIEGSFHYATDRERFFIDLYGGYQSYKLQGDHIAVAPGFDTPPNLDVDAWLAGVGAGVSLGPVYVRANLFKAQNGNIYGLTNESHADEVLKNPLYIPQIDPKGLLNNETLGYALIVGYRFNERLRLEVGYGHTRKTHDVAKFVPKGGVDASEKDAYYLQVPLTVAPNFVIVPEAGYYDFNADHLGRDQGGFSYFGAKWQINF